MTIEETTLNAEVQEPVEIPDNSTPVEPVETNTDNPELQDFLAASETQESGTEPEVQQKPEYLDSKFTSIEEQAKAYNEAVKQMTKKAQEAAEYKKQLEQVASQQPQAQDVEIQRVEQEYINSEYNKLLQYAGYSNNQQAIELINAFYQTNNLDYYEAFINSIPQTAAMQLGAELKEMQKGLEQKKNEFQEKAKQAQVEQITNWKNSILSSEEKQEFFSNPINKQAVEAYFDVDNFTPDLVMDFISKIRADERERAMAEIQAQNQFQAQHQQGKSKLTSAIQSIPQSASGERIFTAKEIDAMPDSEFRKYEKEIDRQIAQGLVK